MKKITIIFLTFFVSSCTYFLFEELAHIHKGMSLEEVRTVIDNSDYGPGIDLINDEINQDLYTYNNVKYLVTERNSYVEIEYYIFIFVEEKLVYWGLPYQIANNSNSEISSTSEDISRTIREKYLQPES